MNNELIVVKQLPVIEQQLKSIGEELDKNVELAESLVCTDESIKQLKSIRAANNKKFEQLEKERISAKKQILAPYEALDTLYKEHISSKHSKADGILKTKISTFESNIKDKKTEEVKAYFTEYASSLQVEWLKYDQARINVTLGASMKSLKEAAKSYIDKVNDDLAVIESQEHPDEVLVEYKACMNLARAAKTVSDRYEALERESAAKAEREAKKGAETEALKAVESSVPTKAHSHSVSLGSPVSFSPPQKVSSSKNDDPVCKLTFTVEAPKSKLKKLKEFLIDGGYING